MKVTKDQIDSFLNGNKIAIAGVSRSPKKFGYQVYKELMDKNFPVLAINPNADTINGETCYKSVSELPADVDSILIVTPKHQTDAVLHKAIKKGIKNIWVQQMSDTEQTLNIAEEYQREIIFGKCVFMFAEPVKGFHKFHKTLIKLFGGLPK